MSLLPGPVSPFTVEWLDVCRLDRAIRLDVCSRILACYGMS